MGFSVGELADIFRERNAGGAPCHRVRKLAAEKLALLEAKLRDLQNWRRELRATLKAWDRRLSKTPRGKQARLLETLAHRRAGHDFRLAAFANGRHHETDSFTGVKHCFPIGPESEAGGVSDARRPYSDERAGRERHGFFAECLCLAKTSYTC
jgi:hypothetical protein